MIINNNNNNNPNLQKAKEGLNTITKEVLKETKEQIILQNKLIAIKESIYKLEKEKLSHEKFVETRK